MDDIEITTVSDISKLLNIHQAKPGIIYRGEPKNYASTKLLPNLGRIQKHDHQKEWGILETWHNKMRELGKNEHIQNHWEILFEAQHYGLKTRLLDWTENPYFALWTACGGYDKWLSPDKDVNQDGAYIYYIELPYKPLVIDSIGANIVVNNLRWESISNWPVFDNPIFPISDRTVNQKFGELDFDNPHNEYSFNQKDYFKSQPEGEGKYGILFVRPAARANPRIVSQSGLFSVHCPPKFKFRQKADKNNYKFKTLRVSHNIKNEILKYLDSLNMNETSYGFTSPESYARKLNYEYELLS